ncbi:MAG: hypothetical protein Q8Q32_02800 [bacterium]|nr:hypothetical protein [bacterium]
MSMEVIIFWVLLIDSVGANLMVFFGGGAWYVRHFPSVSKYFPPSKGWVVYYLFLVLLMGWMMTRLGISLI